MHARTLPDGSLVIAHGAWYHLAAAAGLLGLTAWALLDPAPESRQRLGGAIYAGFALLLLATWERSVFLFDPATGRVVWRRDGVFRRRSGTLSLDAVEGIAVETLRDGRPPYTHRLALVMRDGRLPLTNAYYGSHERLVALGAAIQAAVRPRWELGLYK